MQPLQDLVFTLFGEYFLHRDGPVWVGSLIGLLEPMGTSQGAVRTVLSRMARAGWLTTTRSGRHAFYELTPRGRRLLEEGEERILHPSWDQPWDGSWVLLAYSIPEDVRHLRDRLRDRLAWLGFGSLGNGLWISPHDVHDAVADVADELGIQEHVECFTARRIGDDDASGLVAKCWDVPGLNRKYRAFARRWESELARCQRGLADGKLSPESCFTLRFDVIHEFRRFPLEDPYLPRALLPDDWSGERATELFHQVHDALVGPADRYVDEVVADAPEAPASARAAG